MADSTPRNPARVERHFLSRLEVAKLFDVSPHTIYRWSREGRLPYFVTLGGCRRYPREAIMRLVAEWLHGEQPSKARPA